MAEIQRSSFQKRGAVKKSFIKGTYSSLHNSQLLISSGIPSFDGLLGGGIPVGSLLLINEDEYATYAKLMVKYFIAEGLVSKHSLFFASEDIDSEQMVLELPSPVNEYIEVTEEEETEAGDKKMAIAWRYENLKRHSHDRNKYFGHYFDLSKTINAEVIKNSDITFFSRKEVSSNAQETIYSALLKSIQKKLEEGHYFANDTKTERNILRIVVFHINSPLWNCDMDSDSEKHLLKFLYSLRALIRNAYATCYITLPYGIHKEILMNKCTHFCDTAVQLQSFTGTDYENEFPFKDYNGLFMIQKLAAINTLTTYNSQAANLAFKLKRKKFVIEAFYLPPELEDTTEREKDDSSVLMCTSSRSNKLDF